MATSDAPRPVVSKGLEGIILDNSAVSYVDGQASTLIYRGIDIRELAEHSTFEETVYLLWYGQLPTRGQLDQFTHDLTSNYEVPAPVIDFLRSAPKKADAMHILRTLVSDLALYDPKPDDLSLESLHQKGICLVAMMPGIVAAYDRIRNDRALIAPVPDKPVAWNFLHMLHGQEPTPTEEHALDVCLVLHADHEMNASTFSARVTASTNSDMYSAVTSAIGTLKGPLHGGANEEVIDMLRAIGTPAKAEPWVMNEFKEHRRIFGFGHRVYKTGDPRARILKEMSRRLGEQSGHPELYQMSSAIEATVFREKGLYPNVDFLSASVYYDLKIPVDLFTPVFTISRIGGWTAQLLEQYQNNRLIRPRIQYSGPTNVPYIPIEDRK